jgi:glycosyltransferase involved in cell wall biosynthesis
MHILLIHQAFTALDEPGGTRHHELARFLADQHHQVSIITSPISYLTGDDQSKSSFKEDKNGLIRIYRTYTYPALHKSFFHRLISFFSFMFSSFFKSLSVRKVDLVWGTTPPIFQCFTAWLVARLKGAPFLLEVRDLWPEFAIAVGVLKNPLLIKMSYWLERFLYRHADSIVVNSPGFIVHVAEKGGKDIRVIPNGADITQFGILDKEEARKAMGWPIDKFIAVYAGAHGMSNDLEVVLRAADETLDKEEIFFYFVGDGKEKSNLVEKAVSMKLENVRFFPPVSKNKINQTLGGADACIAILKPIELYKTTYPNKVFDYMAAGRPVILAIDGVIRGVVESADCGIFCKPGDPRAMSDAVRYLYNNQKKAERMGLNGRKYLEAHFDRKQAAENLLGLIEDMVGND